QAGSAYVSVAAADFNGDGHTDLAVVDAGRNEIVVWWGNGDGTFKAVQFYPAEGGPQSVVLGDFPGNESMMLIVACAMGVVRVFPGMGDGPFVPGRSFPAGRLPAAAALGDFNLDGIPDLAIVNTGSSTVSVLLGSAGTFQTVPTVDAGAQPSFMSLGYFSH